MGSIGNAFGSLAGDLMGVEQPNIPAVAPPPTFTTQQAGTKEVDQTTRLALQEQAFRRSLESSANRSLEGTGDARIQANQDASAQLVGGLLETQEENLLLSIEEKKKKVRNFQQIIATSNDFFTQANAFSNLNDLQDK